LKQTMKRRLAALAVAGLVALGGTVAASPAQATVQPNPNGHWLNYRDGASGQWNSGEAYRAVGVYHFKFGRGWQGYPYKEHRWVDHLDKQKIHRTTLIQMDSWGNVLGANTVKFPKVGSWSRNWQDSRGVQVDFAVIRGQA
jgi:hypothetical protein